MIEIIRMTIIVIIIIIIMNDFSKKDLQADQRNE